MMGVVMCPPGLTDGERTVTDDNRGCGAASRERVV